MLQVLLPIQQLLNSIIRRPSSTRHQSRTRPACNGAVKPPGAPGQLRHGEVSNAFLPKNVDVRLFQGWVPHYQAFDVIGADGFGNFVPDISTGVN